jgi:hypothetical protein
MKFGKKNQNFEEELLIFVDENLKFCSQIEKFDLNHLIVELQ